MNIEVLKHYVSVVRNLSFTQAAEECHIAQPAISQQIKNLETSLGLSLIVRKGREITITPAGQSFFQDCQRIIRLYETSVEKCKSAALGYYGTLSIGVNGWGENRLLEELLRRFSQQHPHISIELKRTNSHEIVNDLLTEKYDVTTAWPYDLENHAGIQCIPLTRGRTCVLMNKENPLAQEKTVTREQAAEECNIMLSRKGLEKAYIHILSFYSNFGLHPVNIKEASDGDILILMIGLNQGIAVIPELFKPTDMRNMTVVPVAGVPHFVESCIACLSENGNPVLPLFLEFIKNENL
jgi:DNA-binding transcriptional LysR family regulator